MLSRFSSLFFTWNHLPNKKWKNYVNNLNIYKTTCFNCKQKIINFLAIYIIIRYMTMTIPCRASLELISTSLNNMRDLGKNLCWYMKHLTIVGRVRICKWELVQHEFTCKRIFQTKTKFSTIHDTTRQTHLLDNSSWRNYAPLRRSHRLHRARLSERTDDNRRR